MENKKDCSFRRHEKDALQFIKFQVSLITVTNKATVKQPQTQFNQVALTKYKNVIQHEYCQHL